MALESLGPGVDWSVDSAKVAAGDIAALLMFVIIGELNHNINPFLHPFRTLDSLMPFLIGWVLLAPLAGAYSREARDSMGGAMLATTVAWLLADIVGQLLRASDFFHGGTGTAFIVVSIVYGLAFLLPWRYAVVKWRPLGIERLFQKP